MRRRLDEVERLYAESSRLLGQAEEIERKRRTTTDQETEDALSGRLQNIHDRFENNAKNALRALRGAVDLVSGYTPAKHGDWEAAIKQTGRLVDFLKMERDAILGDPHTPDDMVNERGIATLLERAVAIHDRLLKGRDQGQRDGKLLPIKGDDNGLISWFNERETAVQVALITALASVIGGLLTVVVAIIRRHD